MKFCKLFEVNGMGISSERSVKMKNTLVVNLIAAPSSGKSTLMADIFAKLKWENIDCELVTEFAKDLVWEERTETFKDELYIFAKQNHRMFRVNGKVDVIITDRPLILTILYNNKYGKKSKELDELVYSEFDQYNNLNYFINRKKPYNPNGRNQTESESDEIAEELLNILYDYSIAFEMVDGIPETADLIVNQIKGLL
jgi:nicotinamide riboside kinase